MNTSMFLPQAPMADVYDANGNQEDDITSIVELVRVKLGFDHTADDENDDSGQNFHIVSQEYTVEPFSCLMANASTPVDARDFQELQQTLIPSVSYDILVPPPKDLTTSKA